MIEQLCTQRGGNTIKSCYLSVLHEVGSTTFREECGKFSRLTRINLENYPLPIFQNVFYPNSWITVLVNRIVVPQGVPNSLVYGLQFCCPVRNCHPRLDGLEVSFTTPRKTASLKGRCFRRTVRSRHFSH